LWVPVAIRPMGGVLADLPRRMGYFYRRILRLYQQEGKGEYRAKLSATWNLLCHAEDHLRYKTAVFGDHLSQLLITQNVDLLALHWLNYDAGALISRARKARIPFVFINHFSNSRFSLPLTRKWITGAAALGAVSDEGIPDSLRNRFVSLSDAVDTEFFSPEKALPVECSMHPIVLLPARIEYGKGHHDLMEAARILMAKKTNLVVCFAGAVDSESLHQELRRSAAAMGLEERVLFLGERSPEEIRDWYSRSSIVVLPTYSEGLGRVLLEAQAMKKPVVAYDSGGTSRAVLAHETGFLVKTGDVKALADKISFLLVNEAEGLRIGERGRKFVSRQFSLSALIQRHESLYVGVLTRARAMRKTPHCS
jgi:glycosyltransferase involved in cell wall biosynthesis